MLNKIIHTYWTRLLAASLAFAAVALTSRYLGADGKGLTSLISTNLLFITLVNELVGGVSLIYLIPRRQPLALLVPALLFALADSLLLAAFFHALNIIPKEYSVHLYALGVLQTLSNTVLYVLLGLERVKANNYLFLLKTLVNAVFLAVFFILLGNNTIDVYIYALYASNIIPLVSGGILLFPFIRKNSAGSSITIASVREMLAYGSFAQLANLVQTLNYRLSFYLLNLLSGQKAVGIFSVALAVSDVVWMLTKSIGTVQLTRIANTEDVSQAHILTKKFLRYGVLTTFLFLIPVAFLPGEIYALVFGNEFGRVSDVMLAMAAGILIFSINIILANHFAGTGRYGINLTASLIGLAVNAAANLLLIPRWGLTGAGIAASLTYGVSTSYTWWRFSRESAIDWKNIIIGKEDLKKIALTVKEFSF